MIVSLVSRLRALARHPASLAGVAIAGFLMTPACSAATDSTTGATVKTPASLVLVQGASQSVQAGRDLPTPIVFRAVDSSGVGMPGVTVSLSVLAGGGTVTPASDTTDALGEFKSKWTLGPGVAAQQIVAAAPGVAPVSVSATGLLPTLILLVQGSGQSAKTGTAVTNAIVVRVVGDNNVPMQGVTVGFQVLLGGGGMTPATVVTNALGEASTKWTLGTVGGNLAVVASGSLPTVTINATATP